MPLSFTQKVRFDDNDVAPPGVCYSGFDYHFTDDWGAYCVRAYDDEPHAATIISPESISCTQGLRRLVDRLLDEFGIRKIWAATDESECYGELDLKTLQLLPDETKKAQQDEEADAG